MFSVVPHKYSNFPIFDGGYLSMNQNCNKRSLLEKGTEKIYICLTAIDQLT